MVRGEFAENMIREPFRPSEIDAIRRAMEPVEKAAARERMAQGGKGGKLSQPSSDEPERVRDKIGAFAGVSGRTVEKIAKVIEAAKAEPDLFTDGGPTWLKRNLSTSSSRRGSGCSR